MRKLALFLAAFISITAAALADDTIIKGFETPESIAVYEGDYYVSNINGFGKDGDGTIKVIHNGKVSVLADGLNDPKGIWIQNDKLYVTDRVIIWEIELKGKNKGKKSVYADKFPVQPKFLNDLVGDREGNLYVSDTGEFDKMDGYIFKVSKDKKARVFSSYIDNKNLGDPNGLIFNKVGDLLVIDMHNGKLIGYSADGTNSITLIDGGFEGGDGLAYDNAGNLYVSSWGKGMIFRMDPHNKIEAVGSGYASSADITIDKEKKLLVIPEFKGGQVRLVKIK